MITLAEAAAREAEDELEEACYTDEQVHHCLYSWPGANQERDEVQALAHEHADADEAPV